MTKPQTKERSPRRLPARTSSTSVSAPTNDFLPPKVRDLFFRKGPKGQPVYVPSRYKIAYGGRGSGKSWALAGLAIALGYESKLRILCVREYQSSTNDSIYQLIAERIEAMGLGAFYTVQSNGIYGANGTEFIFAGIKTDPGKIKSFEGANICLVEEAERISKISWTFLLNTIRGKHGQDTEIWVCFNPRDVKDPTYKMFVEECQFDMRRVRVNWDDNPWFPQDLDRERRRLLWRIEQANNDDDRAQLQNDYDHIWNGEPQKNSNATILRKRVVVHTFDPPDHSVRLYYGADWGYSVDPTCLIRFWITRSVEGIEEIWIDYEAYGYNVENDEIPQLFDAVPGSRDWPIKADGARPETISHVKRLGFNITAAEKWPGSLEDGLAHLKSYHRIHIHERCKHLQEEARLYSYKIDRITQEVLPIIVDANNHGIDAIRYGLDGVIQRRGSVSLWAKLARPTLNA